MFAAIIVVNKLQEYKLQQQAHSTSEFFFGILSNMVLSNLIDLLFVIQCLITIFVVTKDLVRKKAEHNEMMIGNLEELSLHQENVEKMEHLHDWCRELKILLMQSNLIPKIENVFKFKKLEYFNLAINNIERIENLEELESLQKLDLTLNFIGELTSVDSLKENYNLSELNLTGNPCTDYEFYRDYVITVLPQLKTLDGVEITITDRLLAKKDFDNKRKKIVQREAEYKIKRDEQKIRIQLRREQDEIELANLTEDERNKKYVINLSVSVVACG